MPNNQPNPWRLAHLGMDLAGATLVMGFFGWLIDQQFDSEPWALLIGGGMGFIGGMYLIIKQAMRINRS